MMDELTSLGYWIRRRRKALDLTQDELAQRVGVATVTLRKIEADERRPSKEIAARLADALELDAAEGADFLAVARAERWVGELAVPVRPVEPAVQPTREPHRGNLPVQTTALVGREQEVSAVCALVRRDDMGLVTLTGPGGAGKTRLGLHVAGELLDAFADGVYFVDLAPINDPALVISAIATTLGIKEAGSQPLLTTVQAFLVGQQILLLLDNFEHLLGAAALVADLLKTAPSLKVLVTSRIVLRIYGEQEYPVPPLGLPDHSQQPSLESLSHYPAIALFIQRAQAVKPAFHVTNANALTVAEICRRLEGLPLAIELAAARSKVLMPEELLARLTSRLRLLTGGARDRPKRHQTIRATIDWSYQLLDATEQRLFARLAVFVGGWTAEAAETICGGDDLDVEVLDGLQSLIDKSLIREDDGIDDRSRFSMLETIREYALEMLAASGEADVLQQTHGRFFVALAEVAEPELIGPREVEWHNRLEAEHDNLQAVLQWAFRPDATRAEIETGLRVAAAVSWFWRRRGHLSEGRRWLGALLARCSDPSTAPSVALRAKACQGAGRLALDQGDEARGIALFEESRALCRQIGDRAGLAWALNNLGLVAWRQGDYAHGVTLTQESRTLFQELQDWRGVATALFQLSRLASSQGDYRRATELAEESIPLFRDVGDRGGLGWTLWALGQYAVDEGDTARAIPLAEAGVALFRELDDKWGLAVSLESLGAWAGEQGNPVRAVMLLGESLALSCMLEETEGIIRCLVSFAMVAGVQQQPARAARLFGAAERAREARRIVLAPMERSIVDAKVASVHAQLDAGGWSAAWAEGRAMTLEQAIAYALEVPPDE